jgi:ATP-dependent DNA helicase RecG
MPGETWQEALAAIERGADAASLEHQTLDFKAPDANLKSTLRTLADAAVCFANADGGTIVVGVRDRGGPASIVGIGPDLSTEVVRRGIFDRTQPHLTVRAQRERYGDVDVLVVTVLAGVVPCATSDGTASRRLGDECRPFTPDQQREWLVGRGQLDWSEHPSGVGLDEVSRLEIERLRDRLHATGRDDLVRLETKRLLGDLRLTSGDELRNAGLLLVGTEEAIRRAMPTYGYGYQYRPTAGSEATARLRETRPLLAGIERVSDVIESRASVRPLNLAGGLQLTLVDFPPRAVRELVVNAFIHRNYEANGSVEVEHTPDGLDVLSPGGLVAGVTADNILTHPSAPRNRLLTETVALLGIAERTGQGIDRAYRELLRLGKRPISVVDTGSLVRVRIEGGAGNDAFARFVAGLPDDRQGDLDVLLTLSLLCQRRTIGEKHLAPVIQRTVPEAASVLSRLASDSAPLVEPTRRGGTYRLGQDALVGLGRAVRYHAAAAGDFDAKVAGHLREYGTITNRTLQRLFDLSIWGARDALRDLQQRGIVEKVSQARTGPGVQYGPGPNLPKDPPRARRGKEVPPD